MITKELNNIEKCCIYANDFHLEMVLLPFIKENLEKTKFVILTENNLEDSVKILLDKVNINKEIKNEIFGINWKNNNAEKIENLKNSIFNFENITLIIKGCNNFINEISKIVDEFNEDCLEIIKCYSVEQLKESNINLNNCDILNTKRM